MNDINLKSILEKIKESPEFEEHIVKIKEDSFIIINQTTYVNIKFNKNDFYINEIDGNLCEVNSILQEINKIINKEKEETNDKRKTNL